MPLGTGYDQQSCFLARALEVVGERWTLLILRDCFFGVRHFNDLLAHLDISRAILTDRLTTLVDAGVLAREPSGRAIEYTLTPGGLALWPTLYSLARWGERHLDADHPARVFTHTACGSAVDDAGRCAECGTTPLVQELTVSPGPGAVPRGDRVSLALSRPHPMLSPIR